jgi:hypothetical protein
MGNYTKDEINAGLRTVVNPALVVAYIKYCTKTSMECPSRAICGS